MNRGLLIANLVATLLLTTIAWSLQFVQLPILLAAPTRRADLSLHRRLNSRLVIVPMIVEAVAATWLVFVNPSAPILVALALWCGAAIGTAGYTMAHSHGTLDRLPRWNLMRMLCWTLRSAVLLYLCFPA